MGLTPEGDVAQTQEQASSSPKDWDLWRTTFGVEFALFPVSSPASDVVGSFTRSIVSGQHIIVAADLNGKVFIAPHTEKREKWLGLLNYRPVSPDKLPISNLNKLPWEV